LNVLFDGELFYKQLFDLISDTNPGLRRTSCRMRKMARKGEDLDQRRSSIIAEETEGSSATTVSPSSFGFVSSKLFIGVSV